MQLTILQLYQMPEEDASYYIASCETRLCQKYTSIYIHDSLTTHSHASSENSLNPLLYIGLHFSFTKCSCKLTIDNRISWPWKMLCILQLVDPYCLLKYRGSGVHVTISIYDAKFWLLLALASIHHLWGEILKRTIVLM